MQPLLQAQFDDRLFYLLDSLYLNESRLLPYSYYTSLHTLYLKGSLSVALSPLLQAVKGHALSHVP